MTSGEENISLKKQIGAHIAELREQKNLTQLELAELSNTSQSAIARIENGEQNITAESILKIGQALEKPIVKVTDKSMDFQVTGGKKLSGTVTTNTSKNGAMGLLCASLLNEGKTILYGIPKIEEVFRIIEIMESIGVSIKWQDNGSLEIKPPARLEMENLDKKTASKTRTIIMFFGPLIHLFDKFSLPHSSGCSLGKRSISAHLFGLEKFGVNIDVTDFSYDVTAKNLSPSEIVMYEAGDTPTENLLMAAAKIPGKSIIKFASANYMVQDVCFFLQKLGVKIEGIGTSTLVVHGVDRIKMNVVHYNSEDPIESMMFLSAAITTKSSITIKACPIDFLSLELLKLEKMGFKYTASEVYKSKNEYSNLVDITTYASDLVALDDKIASGPYPAINIDNLPFFVPIATQAQGTTLIHDWTFEDRAMSFMEFRKLGARINLADPHRVFITGSTKLVAAQIVAPPIIRSAMCTLIGMMAADGVSILRNVYSIRRGYEDIANRLNALGADIKVINGV